SERAGRRVEAAVAEPAPLRRIEPAATDRQVRGVGGLDGDAMALARAAFDQGGHGQILAGKWPMMDMPASKNNRNGVSRGGKRLPASRPAPPGRAGRDPAAGPCRVATVRPGD